ncbi:MAG TPA: HEAT repeat domain-containing protein [Vicinamibacteria bacterium]|nr:HEAT repeat domain-containing protein [Vicinamibacteria bacterium]
MRRLASLLANLALAGVSLALCAVGLEWLARLGEKPRAPRPVAEYLWDWEERWERDFYTVGSNASGWPPGQEWNADGLRDAAHPVDKIEGDWRVAVLGDSVTLGAGIEAKEAFPQVLQAALEADGRRVEVMNVALWGWSTRQQRIAWERIARRYRPDQAILAVCLNDLAELQNNLARPPRWLSWLHERSALVRRAVDASGREIGSVEELFREPDAERVRHAFALFHDEVRALRRAVEADGARLDVAVLPFRFQVEPGAPQPTAQASILAFCAREGLRCVDLLPALGRLGAAAFVDYDHLSAAGARVVASELGALLPDRPTEPELLGGRDPAGALGDPSPAVRRAAARALGAQGAREPVSALFEALGDPREAVRWAAARALDKIGATPADVSRLEKALRNDDPYVRSFAAYSLGRLGEAAAPAVPALIDAYRREEKEGRGAAVVALGALGPAAAPAVPALVEGLANPVNHRRWTAARSLGRIGPAAKEAVPALIEALEDPNEHVRVYVAQALGRLGVEAAAAVPALQQAARDEHAAVSREAQNALRRIRGLPAAVQTAPALTPSPGAE